MKSLTLFHGMQSICWCLVYSSSVIVAIYKADEVWGIDVFDMAGLAPCPQSYLLQS